MMSEQLDPDPKDWALGLKQQGAQRPFEGLQYANAKLTTTPSAPARRLNRGASQENIGT